MTPNGPALFLGIALLGVIAAYALFAGADFGGGIWDLLAGSTARGSRPRASIDDSVTPVWEGNNVWIIGGLVILWTSFPIAFGAISTELFVPLALSLLGIVLRGVGFAFRHEARTTFVQRLAGACFASSSLLAPFFLGAALGAVTTGRVRVGVRGNVLSAWTSPVAVVTGLLFVASCSFIAAVFLVGDTSRRGEDDMVPYFSKRAIASGIATGALALLNMFMLRLDAPYVYHRLLWPASPLVALSVLAGAAALVLVVVHRPWALRLCGALSIAAVVAAWGFAQYPYLFPTNLSIRTAAGAESGQWAEIAVVILAVALVVPSFAYLYYLHQTGQLHELEIPEELDRSAMAENTRERETAAIAPRPAEKADLVALGVVLIVAMGNVARQLLRGRAAARRQS